MMFVLFADFYCRLFSPIQAKRKATEFQIEIDAGFLKVGIFKPPRLAF